MGGCAMAFRTRGGPARDLGDTVRRERDLLSCDVNDVAWVSAALAEILDYHFKREREGLVSLRAR